MGPTVPSKPKNRACVEVVVILLACGMGRCSAGRGSAKRTCTVPASANTFFHSGVYKFAGIVLYAYQGYLQAHSTVQSILPSALLRYGILEFEPMPWFYGAYGSRHTWIEKIYDGSYHAQNPLLVPTGGSESVETSNSDPNSDMVNKFQNMNRCRYFQSTEEALSRN